MAEVEHLHRRGALRAWLAREPGRVIAKGHPVGDFLLAYEWEVLDEKEGCVRVRAQLPEHTRNTRGHMFGGFAPTYADFLAIFAVRAADWKRGTPARSWLATTSMRVDYFEPITGPTFEIDCHVIKRRGRSIFVETRFFNPDGALAVLALTTFREIPLEQATKKA